MQKNLKKWIIAVAAVAAAAAMGVTLAFMFQKAQTVSTFTKAVVSCSVHEKMDDTEVSDTFAGGNEKSDIRVKNTGNVKAYLRVRLVSFFVDADGNVSGAAPSVYPEMVLNGGWIAGEDHTYYYTEPVEPNEFTPVMCEPFALSKKVMHDGETLYQVVEVFAEACQAEPDAAVQEAWGVVVTNGTVTATR